AAAAAPATAAGLLVRSPPPETAERPTPVLFLAPEGLGAGCWEPFLQHFSSRGVTVAACALGVLGGYGGGGRADKEGGGAGISDGAGLVDAVSALQGPPPVLVAVSMGAFVAQRYLESRAAAGICLINPFPPPAAPAAATARLLATVP
ncbi:unnamed protein product, partial [Phaeothamnion confervicola]